MKVFVSHIAEEAELASVLKDWIEPAFLGQVEVFVSVVDISSGEQWFQRLGEELRGSQVLLAICSPQSVSMPWINFEVGACHGKGMPVIPVCHSGIKPETLPVPLLFFQGLDAGTDDFGDTLMRDLAGHLGFSQPPQIRYEEMMAAIRETLSSIRHQPQSSGEEMGFLDHVVSAMDKMESLRRLVLEFGERTTEITKETEIYVNQQSNVRSNSDQGTVRYLQRISRQFGKHLDSYSEKIHGINRNYEETLPEVGASLEHILMSQASQSSEDLGDIDQFVTTMDGVESSLSEWKTASLELRGTISVLPNIERTMNRALRRTVEEFDVLVANIDKTLDMMARTKAIVDSVK